MAFVIFVIMSVFGGRTKYREHMTDLVDSYKEYILCCNFALICYTATGMREMKRERDNLCVREREGERDREQFVGKRESLTPN